VLQDYKAVEINFSTKGIIKRIAITDWFLWPRRGCVYCAVRTGSATRIPIVLCLRGQSLCLVC